MRRCHWVASPTYFTDLSNEKQYPICFTGPSGCLYRSAHPTWPLPEFVSMVRHAGTKVSTETRSMISSCWGCTSPNAFSRSWDLMRYSCFRCSSGVSAYLLFVWTDRHRTFQSPRNAINVLAIMGRLKFFKNVFRLRCDREAPAKISGQNLSIFVLRDSKLNLKVTPARWNNFDKLLYGGCAILHFFKVDTFVGVVQKTNVTVDRMKSIDRYTVSWKLQSSTGIQILLDPMENEVSLVSILVFGAIDFSSTAICVKRTERWCIT